jgi:streptogramin lyase
MHKLTRPILIRSASIIAIAAGAVSLTGAAQAATSNPGGTVSIASSTDTFQGVVIDPTSTTAYFTVPGSNQVDVLNLKKGTWSKPIPVGSGPRSLDITPDGGMLLVADSGQTISEVNLKNDQVTTVQTPNDGLSDTPYSIVALNNGTALFTTTFNGSGFGGRAYSLNLSTGAITPATGIGIINGEVTEATPLSRSADYSTAAAVLGDDSGGPFDVYSAATGNTVSGNLNAFINSGALSGNGSKLLIDGTYVIDATTGALLGTISGSGGNAVLTADGDTGYAFSGSSITELNTTDYQTGQTISLPDPASGGGQLALSPNGKYLVAETSGGAAIVNL